MLDLEQLAQNASLDFKARNPELFGYCEKVGGISADLSKLPVTKCQNSTQSGKDFESAVIRWLRENGWRVAHFRPGLTRRGQWVTAVSGDGKGFPDILAAQGKHCIALECKTGSGKASPEQVEWMLTLDRAGIKAYLATPENWEEIKAEIEMLKEAK